MKTYQVRSTILRDLFVGEWKNLQAGSKIWVVSDEFEGPKAIRCYVKRNFRNGRISVHEPNKGNGSIAVFTFRQSNENAQCKMAKEVDAEKIDITE